MPPDPISDLLAPAAPSAPVDLLAPTVAVPTMGPPAPAPYEPFPAPYRPFGGAPDAPEEASPPDAMGETGVRFKGLPEGWTPMHDYILSTIADHHDAKSYTMDEMRAGAQAGKKPSDMVGDGVPDDGLDGVDDSVFRGLEDQLRAEGANAPVPRAPLRPTAPSLAQVGVALGAGLLAPRLMTQALAAPFEAQLEQNAIDNRFQAEQDAYAQRAHGERIQGLRDALDAEGRRLSALEGVASRQQIASQARQDRDFRAREAAKTRLFSQLHDAAGDEAALHGVFAAYDSDGFGDSLPQASRDALVGEARRAAGDKAFAKRRDADMRAVADYLGGLDGPGVSPAVRGTRIDLAKSLLAKYDPDDPAIAVLEARRGALVAPTPGEANLDARTRTLDATRAGRVASLLATGRPRAAQALAAQAQADLAQSRVGWVDPGQAARIVRMERETADLRARADGTHAGQLTRPSQSLGVLQKNDATYGDAVDRTTQEIDSLGWQKQALVGLAGAPSAGPGRSDDLDRVDALLEARRADLARMSAYRAGNREAIARVRAAAGGGSNDPTVPYDGGPLPPAGPTMGGDGLANLGPPPVAAGRTRGGTRWRVVGR